MIVITGASGYIGSHLSRRLVSDGKSVRAIVHNRQHAQSEGRLKGLDVELVEADVTKPESLKSALDGATVIIHTVAIAIEKGGKTYEAINFQGTVNLVDAARSAGVARFVNISQLGAAPQLPYRFLASKGKAQEYVAASGLDWTAFRPCVIWGPEDEFANTFARLVPFTPLIFPIIGDENSLFQPVWVDDVVSSVAKSLDDPLTIGKEYELGGPEILTLEQIERRTLAAINARRKMVHFPMSIIKVAVSLMESLLSAPPVTHSLLELLMVSNVTTENSINNFVSEPRPFTIENISPYMKNFTVSQTINMWLGKV